VILEAPITYQVDGPDPRLVHSPMVRAEIEGRSTLLILDTGATDSVFTAALIRSIGAPLQPAPDGTDHAGAPVPSWTTATLSLRIGDLPLRISDAIVIEGPAPFEGWGIGGILSPQTLRPDATMILDLRQDRLVVLEGPSEAALAWATERAAGLTMLSLARHRGEGDSARLIVVDMAVAPFPPVPTMLNSGGRHAEFVPDAVPELVVASAERTGRGLSGADVVGAVHAEQTLVVAGARVPLDRIVVREQSADGAYRGQIGMSELRGSVLVIPPRGERVRWFVPQEGGAR
jgi:hypothetical protein